MQMHAGPKRATLRAFALLQDALNSQSQLWAYVDDFRYLALLCAICIPMALFLKRTTGGGQAAG
jgi:DHA2 family multidrug resistance protein